MRRISNRQSEVESKNTAALCNDAALLLRVKFLEEKLEHCKAGHNALQVRNDDLEKNFVIIEQEKDAIYQFLHSKLQEQADRVEQLEENLAKAVDQLNEEREVADGRLQDQRSEYEAQIQDLEHLFAVAREKLSTLDNFANNKVRIEIELAEAQKSLELEQTLRREDVGRLGRQLVQEKDRLKKQMLVRIKETKKNILVKTEDQLLNTTRRTLYENEQMVNELEFQSKETQKMLQQLGEAERKSCKQLCELNVANQTIKDLTKTCVAQAKAKEKSNKRNAELTEMVEEAKQRNVLVETEAVAKATVAAATAVAVAGLSQRMNTSSQGVICSNCKICRLSEDNPSRQAKSKAKLRSGRSARPKVEALPQKRNCISHQKQQNSSKTATDLDIAVAALQSLQTLVLVSGSKRLALHRWESNDDIGIHTQRNSAEGSSCSSSMSSSRSSGSSKPSSSNQDTTTDDREKISYMQRSSSTSSVATNCTASDTEIVKRGKRSSADSLMWLADSITGGVLDAMTQSDDLRVADLVSNIRAQGGSRRSSVLFDFNEIVSEKGVGVSGDGRIENTRPFQISFNVPSSSSSLREQACDEQRRVPTPPTLQAPSGLLGGRAGVAGDAFEQVGSRGSHRRLRDMRPWGKRAMGMPRHAGSASSFLQRHHRFFSVFDQK